MPDISPAFFLLLIPIVLALLIRSDWAFYVFMVGLPLDLLASDQFLTVTRILGLLALVSFFLSRLTLRLKIKTDRAFWVMVIFLIWCTLSNYWSIDPSLSLVRVASIFQLIILYLLVINQVETEMVLTRTMIAISIGATLLATSGVIEMLRGATTYKRLEGIARNPNWYFVVAICMIPALYWLIVNYQNIFIKVYAILILGALFVTAINTQSRGGLISLSVFFLSYLALTDKQSHAKCSFLHILLTKPTNNLRSCQIELMYIR